MRRAAGGVSFGVVWFLLLLVPSSALVMLDRGEPMAEHRVYLASCGLFLAAGLAAGRLWEWVPADRRILRGVLAISLVAIVVSLAGRTVLRNAVWDSG